MTWPLWLRQWHWGIIDQLLRWGCNEEKDEGWVGKELRKLALFLGLLI